MIWSLRDFPALLAFIGAKINSLALLPQTKFLLNPMKAAMLGCIEGTERRRRFKVFGFSPSPLEGRGLGVE